MKLELKKIFQNKIFVIPNKGIFGLFIGISFVTLFEIVEIFIEITLALRCKF